MTDGKRTQALKAIRDRHRKSRGWESQAENEQEGKRKSEEPQEGEISENE